VRTVSGFSHGGAGICIFPPAGNDRKELDTLLFVSNIEKLTEAAVGFRRIVIGAPSQRPILDKKTEPSGPKLLRTALEVRRLGARRRRVGPSLTHSAGSAPASLESRIHKILRRSHLGLAAAALMTIPAWSQEIHNQDPKVN
jgi:hypothetical protein